MKQRQSETPEHTAKYVHSFRGKYDRSYVTTRMNDQRDWRESHDIAELVHGKTYELMPNLALVEIVLDREPPGLTLS